MFLPGEKLPWSAISGGVASIYSDHVRIKISISLCVFCIFVWGLLYSVAMVTEVTQDKIYPANSVSALDSFLSRRLLLVFNALLGAWFYLFTYYPVSVFWTCNPEEGKAAEPLGPSGLGLIYGEESQSLVHEMG